VETSISKDGIYASKKDIFIKKRRIFFGNCAKIDVRSPALTVIQTRDEGERTWHEDRIGRTGTGGCTDFDTIADP
jgi:hypothetical protein